MRGLIRPIAVAIVLLGLALPAGAVEPAEQLADPALEARARDISQGLRCPVCRNESIDESNADVAADLRRLVRERLLAGDSNAQVVAHITDRYGEFVLLEPTRQGANLLLWLSGPAMLLLGGAGAALALRRRAAKPEATDLSAEEQARLADLLRK